jgi:predicted flap endonuclease-1-like 5' DNA nuclease
MAKLSKVEGIGEVYAQKLRATGITTTQALLEKGASPQGRTEIAEKTGISERLILEWVNHVDLFRIKGVGEEYSDLLEEAGVDTVPELAQRNPEHLHQNLVAVNQEKKLVRQLPTRSQVSDWIEQAKRLPRVITYY